MVGFTLDIGMGHSSSSPNHEDFPHLSSEEWEALKRLSQVSGATVQWLLTSAPSEVQKEAASQFLERERQTVVQPSSTPASQGVRQSIKVNVTPYDGSEDIPLLRWFCEIDLAIQARQISDESTKVIFTLSNLTGKARNWAYGLRLADSSCFPTLDVLKLRLQDTFEPPQNEFRMRSQFLKLKQGRMTLHEYIQRTRFLASCVVSSPIDMATQVTTFMSGLRDGTVKQYLYRALPKSLEEAFAIAQQEDFSSRLGHAPPQAHGIPSAYPEPEPMDLSVARTEDHYTRRNPRRQPFNGRCHRCQKLGHRAADCRASAPIRTTANAADLNVADHAKNGEDQ